VTNIYKRHAELRKAILLICVSILRNEAIPLLGYIREVLQFKPKDCLLEVSNPMVLLLVK
jgi:hypothetical protein